MGHLAPTNTDLSTANVQPWRTVRGGQGHPLSFSQAGGYLTGVSLAHYTLILGGFVKTGFQEIRWISLAEAWSILARLSFATGSLPFKR